MIHDACRPSSRAVSQSGTMGNALLTCGGQLLATKLRLEVVGTLECTRTQILCD